MPDISKALARGARLLVESWEEKRSRLSGLSALLLPPLALTGCVAQTHESALNFLVSTLDLSNPQSEKLEEIQQLIIQGLKERRFEGDFGQPIVLGIDNPDYLIRLVVNPQTKEPIGAGIITFKDENGQYVNRWAVELALQTEDGRSAASLMVLDQKISDILLNQETSPSLAIKPENLDLPLLTLFLKQGENWNTLNQALSQNPQKTREIFSAAIDLIGVYDRDTQQIITLTFSQLPQEQQNIFLASFHPTPQPLSQSETPTPRPTETPTPKPTETPTLIPNPSPEITSDIGVPDQRELGVALERLEREIRQTLASSDDVESYLREFLAIAADTIAVGTFAYQLVLWIIKRKHKDCTENHRETLTGRLAADQISKLLDFFTVVPKSRITEISRATGIPSEQAKLLMKALCFEHETACFWHPPTISNQVFSNAAKTHRFSIWKWAIGQFEIISHLERAFHDRFCGTANRSYD